MAITLLYFYDLTEDGKYIDTSKVHFCHDTFNKNVDELKEFFKSNSANANDTEIKVYAQNELNPNDSDYEAVRCMMNDIKNESSRTYGLVAGLVSADDPIERKVEMLRYLLEKYFIGTRMQHMWANDDKHEQYCHNYLGMYEFKYWLPMELVKKYDRLEMGVVELTDMTPEEILTYAAPEFYHEIGWWDRQHLRDNAEKMAKISASWMD